MTDESVESLSDTPSDESPSIYKTIGLEALQVIGVVIGIALLLLVLTGTWPPMVAIESGSMEPHMERGDLVFVSATDQWVGEEPQEDTGIVTAATGERTGYEKMGGHGDVIVFAPGENESAKIIHRAEFWVEEGEDWYDKADPDYIEKGNCDILSNCPAPHDGFITKGDNNDIYDQATQISEPVKPEWVYATAEVRVPYAGWFRLVVAGN